MFLWVAVTVSSWDQLVSVAPWGDLARGVVVWLCVRFVRLVRLFFYLLLYRALTCKYTFHLVYISSIQTFHKKSRTNRTTQRKPAPGLALREIQRPDNCRTKTGQTARQTGQWSSPLNYWPPPVILSGFLSGHKKAPLHGGALVYPIQRIT